MEIRGKIMWKWKLMIEVESGNWGQRLKNDMYLFLHVVSNISLTD